MDDLLNATVSIKSFEYSFLSRHGLYKFDVVCVLYTVITYPLFLSRFSLC